LPAVRIMYQTKRPLGVFRTGVKNNTKKSQESTAGTTKEEQHLAKKLKDLIANIDIASEDRRQEYERLERLFGEVLEENEQFHKQLGEMRERVEQLEREEQAQKENHFQNQQLEKQRNADYERLKTQNALLNLRQKKKDDSESDVVRLLKEQVPIFCRFFGVLEIENSEFFAHY
uniref:DUF4200 domain-containing protein n=1 Tax=Gongylonema pulchrum TaxID=637853 RepID=A0A183E1I7_9BILA